MKRIQPGDRFGNLVAIGRDVKHGHSYKWLFKCDCGNTKSIWPSNAKYGHCGCKKRSLKQRLLDKTVKVEGGCWNWIGFANNKVYGQIGVAGGKLSYAHRVSWEVHKDKIPQGMCVLHNCDNSICVNPDHLFLGTVSDNNADCVAKGRHGNPWVKPKLIEAQRLYRDEFVRNFLANKPKIKT